MQGEEEGTEMEGEDPLGTNTQLETSSSEQESSVERKGSCCEVRVKHWERSSLFCVFSGITLWFGLGLHV